MPRMAAVLLLLASLYAHATSCAGPISVCSSFEKYPLVFRGRVLEIVQQPTPAIEITYPDGSTTSIFQGPSGADFRFAVLEVFKGNPGHEIVVSGGSGEFAEGDEYIVYASPKADTRMGQTSVCAGNRLLEDPDRDPDLAWLRAYPTAPPEVSIFGKVTMAYGVVDIPVIKIKLAGEKTNLTTPSAQDRSYRFNGLPPGKYTLSAIPPEGYVNLESGLADVTVAAKGCAEIDWPIGHDTHISGKVTDANGNPVSDAPVGLLRPAETRTGLETVTSRTTDANGSYDFSKVQPGDYWVALYYLGPSNNEAHVPVYYPSAADSSSAELIHLSPSGNVYNIDFVATPPLHSVNLHVHVVNPDGSPVVDAHVIVNDPTVPTHAWAARADENGDADIALYEGREYSLIASTSGYREPACAGPVKFIAKDGLHLGILKLDKTWDQCRTLQKAK